MDRVLILRLESRGVAAEASLNEIPLLRTPASGGCALLPVHEFTLEGLNSLGLQLAPEAKPGSRLEPEPVWAKAELLLPRLGQPAHPDSARSLGELAWAAPADEVFELPQSLQRSLSLPVKFPRWRWQDAPAVADAQALALPVARFLQEQAIALGRADPEPFVQAARLRFEELALAYQQPLDGLLSRWRSRVQLLAAQGGSKGARPPLPQADELRLRTVAGGRLIEVRHADGGAALRWPRADGSLLHWPLRLALVESRFFVLR